ncbi:hypothetical protein OAV21_03485 [bacterium]|jgi:hypothetical protein|nr:hypothetical protein [bacterium]
MKRLHLILAFICLSVLPGVAEQILIESPLTSKAIKFERQSDREEYRLIVSNTKGEVIYKSILLGSNVDTKSIVWNKKSDRVAFSCGSPFLMNCYVLTFKKDSPKLLLLPSPKSGWDNFYQKPVKWKGSRIHLQVTGPYAGKSKGYSYNGSMIISMPDGKVGAKVIDEKIVVEQVAAPNR